MSQKIKITLLIICTSLLSINAQSKYLTKSGEVIFEASVDTFEEVKGKNTSTTAVLNTDDGKFAALALVKGFRFKVALMEEHFNENYAESDNHPKAIFKGVIHNFDFSKLSSKDKSYTFNGTLTFHGKAKTLKNEKLILSKNNDGKIILKGAFKVNVSEFDISIPKVVSKKLTENVTVTFAFELIKKK